MGVTCVTAVIHQAALQDFCVLWLLVAKISNWANDEPACRRVRLEPSENTAQPVHPLKISKNIVF